MAESNVVRELLVRLGVITDAQTDIKKFDAAIDGVKKGLQSAGEYAGQAKQQVALLVGQIAAAGAAGATALGGLVYLTDQTAQYAVAITQQAAALGISTGAYQELTGAMEGMDIEQEQTLKIMEAANDAALSLASGNKESAASFAKLGISAKDLKGKSLDEVFSAIAEGAKNTKDPMQRLDAVTNIFGNRMGTRVLPFLLQGADGIAKLRGEVRDLGGVMDDEALDAANKYDDAVDKLTITIKGIRHEIGAYFLPVLTDLADRMRTWIDETRDSPRRLMQIKVAILGVAAAAGTLFAALAAFRIGSAAYYGIQAIISLASALPSLGAAMTALSGGTGVLGAIGAVLGGLSTGAAVGVLGAIGLTIAGILIPIASFAAGLTTLYLIFEDVMMFLSGTGDTVLGRFVENLIASDSALGATARTFDSMRTIVGSWLSILGSLATMLGVTLAPTIKTITTALDSLYAAVGPLASDVIAAGLEKAFAPFYLFEKVLASIDPIIKRVAIGLAGMAGKGNGIGSLFGGTPDMQLGDLSGFQPGAGLAAAGASRGGSSSISSDDHSSTTFNVNGAQSPAATAGAIAPMVDARRAKNNRATRDSHAGGER